MSLSIERKFEMSEDIKKEAELNAEEEAVAAETEENEAQVSEGAEAEEQQEEAVDLKDLEEEENGDKKKNDKKEEKYKAQIDELNDKLVRQLAEFENFRNRTQKEKDAMFEVGAKSVIEKILPVVDNFERGIAALSEEEKEGSFAKGMLGIYKQLMDELDKLEVKPIEAVGTEFNPDFHNAVMQTESEEYESGIVAEELQKGYTYRDQVVRHSMVSVVS